MTYKIIRFYEWDTPDEVIETGLTLEEAQAHCKDPVTRGITETGERWFDGFDDDGAEESGRGWS